MMKQLRSQNISPCYNDGALYFIKSCDSSVSIALGYRLDDQGSKVRLPEGVGNFSLHHCVQNSSGGAHPVPNPMGIRALSLGVKQPVCEADHSPPSSAEVKE
jgi:hypothetical protein